MVVYYISYGEPQRQPLWQPLLLILLITLALAMAAAIAYGIYELASGSGSGEIVSLEDALINLHQNNANNIILADAGLSIREEGHLDAVKEALKAVALLYDKNEGGAPVNSLATLVPFTEISEPLPQLASLETPEASKRWLSRVDNLKPSDNPVYIYDAVAVAHEALKKRGDSENDNVIVLLTDGSDGGLLEVDPIRLAPCPLGIPVEPGEVCSPVFEQIHVDLNKLVPCPADVAAVAGEVCHPAPGSADGTGITYDRISSTDLEVCPPELGGANVLCYDVVIGYQPVDPYEVDTCPPGFGEEPGNACVDVRSDIDRDELIVLLANSEVHKLEVYIIGLGPGADQISLMLLATAGNGEYIHCSSVDDCKMPD